MISGMPKPTLIFRNSFAGIGTEILEAGRMDGASLLGLVRRIMIPLPLLFPLDQGGSLIYHFSASFCRIHDLILQEY